MLQRRLEIYIDCGNSSMTEKEERLIEQKLDEIITKMQMKIISFRAI